MSLINSQIKPFKTTAFKSGKFIEVTAITPTPLGEGKSTTSLGLIEGLGKIGKNVGGCLRQPSGGPTMNVKGTAAGGGNALLMPMTEFSTLLDGNGEAWAAIELPLTPTPVQPTPTPPAPPKPTPVPAPPVPPAGALAWLKALVKWLEKVFG